MVFTLLALLLSIAVPRYLQTTASSREKARSQNMATIRDAMDKHKADTGSYPAALSDLVTMQYLRNVPIDPVTNSRDWTTLDDPAKFGPGVYDIAPPAHEPATTAVPADLPETEAGAASPAQQAAANAVSP